MKTKVFVGLKRWTTGQYLELERFKDRLYGIILGDPFCSFRMFENSNWEIPVFCESAKEAGMKVVLQTPVYLTERNFKETIKLISFLENKNLLDLIFVQDVGLLDQLKGSGCQTDICWSLWGEGRGNNLSGDLLDFLTQLNVQYLETDISSRVKPLQEYGLKVIYRLYGPQIATFGRFCYTQRLTDCLCNYNSNPCLQGQPSIVSTDGKMELRVNGYTLEYKRSVLNPYPNASPEYITVHVRELNDLLGVL
jgi:hypothetical protein